MTTFSDWTARNVEDDILKAAETELALPKPKGPQKYGSSMPSVVRSQNESYGYDGTGKIVEAKDITVYEQVLGWLAWIEPREDRDFLWYWALAKVNPDRSIAGYAHENQVNLRTLRRQIIAICQRLANELNRTRIVRLNVASGEMSDSRAYRTADSAEDFGQSRIRYEKHWLSPTGKPRPPTEDEREALSKMLIEQNEKRARKARRTKKAA